MNLKKFYFLYQRNNYYMIITLPINIVYENKNENKTKKVNNII